MGAFLTNYQVLSESGDDVFRELQQRIRSKAYVSPSKNGWVTVYDEASDTQDEAELHRIGKEISSRLACVVFAFLVHDSNVFIYFLYEGSTLVDEYNSNPDYFAPVDDVTRERSRGKPEVVLKFCRRGTPPSEIEAILRRGALGDALYGVEEERLRALACSLGIDEDRACVGFKYYEEGELAEIGDFRCIEKAAATGGTKSFADDLASTIKWAQSTNQESLAGVKRLSADRLTSLVKNPRLATSILIAAAAMDDADAARLVIKAGADPNRHEFGTTALLMAAEQGNMSAARALIQGGADVNAKRDSDGVTVLQCAVRRGHVEIVRALIEAGVDINAKNDMGTTALDLATNWKKTEIIPLLQNAPSR